MNVITRWLNALEWPVSDCFSPDMSDVAIRLFGQEGSDHDRRYSLHVASELATLIVGDLSVDTCRFEVIVQSKTTNTSKISLVLPLSDVLPVDT
jgi:hypothetical protein